MNEILNSYRKSSITILFTVALLTGLMSVAFKQSTFAFSIDFSGLPGFGDSQGLNFFKGLKGDTGAQGIKGDTGATGPQGDKGDKGDSGTSSQPAERTVTLNVIKHMYDSQIAGVKDIISASDFIMHINGNNPSPFDFPGSESGTSISIGSGQYAVTETKATTNSPLQFSATFSQDCNGIINDRETKTCIVTNKAHL
jgi:hypothetical protein